MITEYKTKEQAFKTKPFENYSKKYQEMIRARYLRYCRNVKQPRPFKVWLKQQGY